METAVSYQRARTLDEQLTEATTGTLELFAVYLGTRLGLYRALAEHGRMTPAQLCATTGLTERYVREWLEQQAAARFLAVDDASREPAARRYRLPADHVDVLVREDHPAHVAPFADMVVGVAGALDDVVDAFRTGAGVPYSRYGEAFRRGQGGINRPAFTHELTISWLPAAGDVLERLSQPGARVADVGCGHGWSTVALARAYPWAEVVGLDADPASVVEARRNAEVAGVDVSFVEADVADLPACGPFTAVLLLECLHDLAQPVEALAACRKALADGGSVVVVDENVAEGSSAPGDLLERLMYGWSVSHCLPASMHERPSAALGTVLRPPTVRALAEEAGYAAVQDVDVDAGFLRVYRLVP